MLKLLKKPKEKSLKKKQNTKRLPVGPQPEQKIIVDKDSIIKFYNPDFRREIF